MGSLSCFCCISLHDIVTHECFCTHQAETARAAQYRSEHMFSCLLEPMTHSILKFLIPYHWACNTQCKGAIFLIIESTRTRCKIIALYLFGLIMNIVVQDNKTGCAFWVGRLVFTLSPVNQSEHYLQQLPASMS